MDSGRSRVTALGSEGRKIGSKAGGRRGRRAQPCISRTESGAQEANRTESKPPSCASQSKRLNPSGHLVPSVNEVQREAEMRPSTRSPWPGARPSHHRGLHGQPTPREEAGTTQPTCAPRSHPRRHSDVAWRQLLDAGLERPPASLLAQTLILKDVLAQFPTGQGKSFPSCSVAAFP